MIKKKIAAAVLIATLVIGTAVTAFASEKETNSPSTPAGGLLPGIVAPAWVPKSIVRPPKDFPVPTL